jgi:hypothetical protein
VIIRVNGRLIPEWGMDKVSPANAADPSVSPSGSSEPEVELELVPYGCTRLRIAEYPWFRADADRVARE